MKQLLLLLLMGSYLFGDMTIEPSHSCKIQTHTIDHRRGKAMRSTTQKYEQREYLYHPFYR